MKTINIEYGMPTVDAAMVRLKNEIVTLRRTGTKQAKIIHGYGSTGQGGAIKAATQRALREYVRTGTIRVFCPGEQFGPFSDNGRRMVERYPQVKGDSDWARGNDGITVIVF